MQNLAAQVVNRAWNLVHIRKNERNSLHWLQVVQQIEVRVSEMLVECLNSDYSLVQVYLHGKFIVRADAHFHNISLDILFRSATIHNSFKSGVFCLGLELPPSSSESF